MTRAIQPLAPSQDRVQGGERRPVSLHGHAILGDFSMVEIIVRDLSCDGCGIHIPVPLSPGESISVSVLERGVLPAQVRWYANGKAGLAFEPEPDEVGAQARRKRQSERMPLQAEVTMRRLGKPTFRVRVFDASLHGCRIEFMERPEIDELIRIRFDGLQMLDARVCWIEGNCAGVELERAIHPAVFDLLLARMLAEAERA